MLELILVLIPIALLDSTSIIPLCIVILVVLLAGPNPLGRASAFVFGIFLAYLACGHLIMLGLQSVLDEVSAYAARAWASPYTEELLLQILIGLVLLAFAMKIAKGSKARAEKPQPGAMTGTQAFLAGVGLTIIGFPGAVPYFAAIDLTLRAELGLVQRVAALWIYNLAFVVPLALLVLLRLLLGERSQETLVRINAFFDRWGQRVILVLFVLLGVVLVADGIGWLLGYPLIPVT